jgi:hypothetical protein
MRGRGTSFKDVEALEGGLPQHATLVDDDVEFKGKRKRRGVPLSLVYLVVGLACGGGILLTGERTAARYVSVVVACCAFGSLFSA